VWLCVESRDWLGWRRRLARLESPQLPCQSECPCESERSRQSERPRPQTAGSSPRPRRRPSPWRRRSSPWRRRSSRRRTRRRPSGWRGPSSRRPPPLIARPRSVEGEQRSLTVARQAYKDGRVCREGFALVLSTAQPSARGSVPRSSARWRSPCSRLAAIRKPASSPPCSSCPTCRGSSFPPPTALRWWSMRRCSKTPRSSPARTRQPNSMRYFA
jgi:hypothetical protein